MLGTRGSGYFSPVVLGKVRPGPLCLDQRPDRHERSLDVGHQCQELGIERGVVRALGQRFEYLAPESHEPVSGSKPTQAVNSWPATSKVSRCAGRRLGRRCRVAVIASVACGGVFRLFFSVMKATIRLIRYGYGTDTVEQGV